ncbi:hypothetical protein RIF29_04870 [Crotalaria pallida]|uniref:Glutathione S-transferase n=1 Tax=Crotalaria pallida TaxID=3830 RepID=A0AAN9J3Y5_CROPI
MEEVKLHGCWVSGFSTRVVWTLKLKGIPYEYIEEDLPNNNKSPQLLKYNPVYKKVPVLVHAGKPICESMIIVEYIDEIWPHNSLLPADPFEKAQARFWVKYVEDKGLAVFTLFLSIGEKPEKAIKDSQEFLRVIEDHCLCDDKKFYAGDNINIVDIALGGIIHWLEVIQEVVEVKLFEYDKFPRLHSWITHFRSVPVINQNLPDRSKMLVFYKHVREQILALS